MSPQDIEALAPLIGFVVTAFVVSIPVVAFSARFAIKPIADALVRIREAQGGARSADEALLMHDRRLQLMEAELQQIHGTLERLVDADRFRTELEAGSRAAALPAGEAGA
jgi:hypothetical protein